MKKQLPAFLTGFLAAVLVLSLSLSAFAAITGKTTIEVGPISIMVKGEIFQPTDVNGNPVDVFVYKGTTYAPLRALAEAYGLEVSYDGEAKMAVVEEPEEAVEPSAQPVIPGDYSDWSEEEEAAYQEFKGMWRVTTGSNDDIINGEMSITLNPNDNLTEFLKSKSVSTIEKYCLRLDDELYQEYNLKQIIYHKSPGFTYSYGWIDRLVDGWSCGYRTFWERNKNSFDQK